MKKTSKRIIAVLAAGGLIYGLTQMRSDSTTLNPKKARMMTSANPAFKYPQGTPLTDEQEEELRKAILSNLGINPEEGSMQDGSKMTEQIYAQAVSEIKAAMAYYPDTSNQKSTERPLQDILNDLIEYKSQLVAGYHANAGYHMGQIDGISGVY